MYKTAILTIKMYNSKSIIQNLFRCTFIHIMTSQKNNDWSSKFFRNCVVSVFFFPLSFVLNLYRIFHVSAFIMSIQSKWPIIMQPLFPSPKSAIGTQCTALKKYGHAKKRRRKRSKKEEEDRIIEHFEIIRIVVMEDL